LITISACGSGAIIRGLKTRASLPYPKLFIKIIYKDGQWSESIPGF
jgi:hypothetical protein